MRRQVINPEDSKSEGFPEGWGEALRMGRNYTGLKKKKIIRGKCLSQAARQVKMVRGG